MYTGKEILIIIFITLFISAILIALALSLTITENDSKTKEAIEFCGCSDKCCVISYTNGHFNIEEYRKECK